MRTVQPADEGAPPAIRLAGKGALPVVRLATILGMLATAALLGVVSATAGLGVAGWIAGLATGSAATALIVTARMRSDQPAMFPADWVTLTRALLVAGVAGLVADSFVRPVSITALVTLSTVALVLDAVDGQVARRTGTATELGARIDCEVDAFLILLLSIFVSQDYGGWVLAIGAARYALLLAGWLIPWLAAPLPPRYWGKVVAAVQGIVLTVAASGVLDRRVGMIAVAAALLLLAESFGRNVIWLYRTGAGPRTRQALRIVVTVLAVVLVWGCSRRARPCLSIHPRRLCPHPRGSAGPGCHRAGAADQAATDRGRRRWNPVQPAHARQDPQHSVLRADRAGVQPGVRLGQHPPGYWRGTRHDRPHAHKHRARRALARCHPARRRNHRSNDSHHHRGRAASPRHGSRTRRPHSGLGAVRGPVTATHPRIPGRLGQRHQAGRRAGARHPDSAPRPAPFRAGPPRLRPRSQRPRLGPADRIARQGRHHRLRRKLRAGRRSGHELLPRHRRLPAPAAPPRWPAPAGPRRAPGSPRRASAGSASSPTPPCSRGCGSTPNSGMPSWSPAAGSPSATPSTRPAGAPSATTPRTTSPGRPARSSTTTTSFTTGATWATTARASATPRCPTSTPLPSSSGSSSAPATSP